MKWIEKKEYLEKEYKFNQYLDGLDFINHVASIAEKINHHPEIILGFKKVKIKTTTHSKGSITELDHKLCKLIDKI